MRRKALIVEDDGPTRAALTDLVGNAGFEIDQAADGELAVGLLTRNSYDVVVLDRDLPGMSGDEICRVITAHTATRADPSAPASRMPPQKAQAATASPQPPT